MYGLDNPSGISVMPTIAPAVSPSPLWFTEGGAGQAVSYPGQDWYNMFQAEHLNVLADAGIVPVKSDLTQLSKAIKKLISTGNEGFLKTTNNLSEIKNAGVAAMAATVGNIGALPATGTAVAATKLATARKIGGVDFDGTKDITLPFINTTAPNVQLAGVLGVKSLEVYPMPGSAEGGQIDLFDKDSNRVAFIDIDLGGNTRLVSVDAGVALVMNKTTGDVAISKALNVTGAITSVSGGLAITGRGDITGDFRGGRVLSKSDVIVGEGMAGGHAQILSTGDINGTKWGGWLSTYLSNRGVRAWAAVRGDGAMLAGFGFSAITRTNVGGYNFVMSTSNGSYAVTVGINGGAQNVSNIHSSNIWNRTANSFSIQNSRDSGTAYDWTDWTEFYVIVVGP